MSFDYKKTIFKLITFYIISYFLFKIIFIKYNYIFNILNIYNFRILNNNYYILKKYINFYLNII